MRKITFLPIFIVCLVFISSVQAIVKPFDNRRKGFCMTFSTGPGITLITSENYGLNGSITMGTVAFRYQFGYAPTEQTEISYTHRAAVYASKFGDHIESYFDDYANFNSAEGIVLIVLSPIVLPFIGIFTDQHLVMGVGVKYYLRPRPATWFFEGGIGPSIAADPYEKSQSSFPRGATKTGLGLFAGAGYEFTRHGQVGLQAMWSRAAWEVEGIEKKWQALSVFLTITLAEY